MGEIKDPDNAIENISNKEGLDRCIHMLEINLEDSLTRRFNTLCYCSSTPEIYERFCNYIARRMNIPGSMIFEISWKANDGRGCLGRYLLEKNESIEKREGNLAFVQARGFADLVSSISVGDDYTLSRFGHDYDQIASEDFYRNLGRKPLKPYFVLTHIDKNHFDFQRSLKTAAGSQFKFFIFDL